MPTLYECDLSIIIPVYNLERFIQPMIESLKAQQTTFTYEIIWVLNNCTDRSEDIIRESGLGKILCCTVQGCGAARNTGLEESRGEYVWFMDGDDWLLSDHAIEQAMGLAMGKNIIRVPYLSSGFRRQFFSMVWQYVIRRELIDSIRFPEIQPCEDNAFMEAIFSKTGYTIDTYLRMPTAGEAQYYYNYLREGSNMYRFLILHERI